MGACFVEPHFCLPLAVAEHAMDVRWLVLPAIGAAIGWFTNHLAVRMLFVPRRPLTVLGFTLQGLIPRRRTELARNVAQIIERELFSHDDIRAALTDPVYQDRIRERLNARAETYLRQKARKAHWFVGLVLEGDAVGRLKDGLLESFMAVLPTLAADFAEELEDHVDIKELIVRKVGAFDLVRLEEMIHQVAHKELQHIEWIGGVLGLVIGAIQVALMVLLERLP